MPTLKTKIVKQRNKFMSEAFEKSRKKRNIRYIHVFIDNFIFVKVCS